MLLENAANGVGAALDAIEAGYVDIAAVQLVLGFLPLSTVALTPLSIPLQLLGTLLATLTATLIRASANAATGPAISGLLATAVATQTVLNALNEGGPEELANALIGVPGRIADGVLNGFAIVPSTFAFPGILTPGNVLNPDVPRVPGPGPVSVGIVLGQVVRALLSPQADVLMNVNSLPQGRNEFRTVDVVNPGIQQSTAPTGTSGPVVEEKKLTVRPDEAGGQGNVLGADDVTNVGTEQSDDKKDRPRLFGGNSAGQSGGGQGLNNLRGESGTGSKASGRGSVTP